MVWFVTKFTLWAVPNVGFALEILIPPRLSDSGMLELSIGAQFPTNLVTSYVTTRPSLLVVWDLLGPPFKFQPAHPITILFCCLMPDYRSRAMFDIVSYPSIIETKRWKPLILKRKPSFFHSLDWTRSPLYKEACLFEYQPQESYLLFLLDLCLPLQSWTQRGGPRLGSRKRYAWMQYLLRIDLLSSNIRGEGCFRSSTDHSFRSILVDI